MRGLFSMWATRSILFNGLPSKILTLLMNVSFDEG
jgi:hypothetical protein